MPGISIHVVDVTRGLPAEGMLVTVHELRIDGPRLVGCGRIADDGVFRHPMNLGTDVAPGIYEVELATGTWYREQKMDVGEPAVLEIGTFRFNVVDAEEHVHLPIKLSPYGMSIWRGR